MVRNPARLLGWLSVSLGLVQVVAPARILQLLGMRSTAGRRVLTRLIGVRELGAAPGLLTVSAPVGWLAARILGDVMDLLLLMRALGARGSDRGRVRTALAAVLGVLMLDVVAAVAARRRARRRDRHAGRIVRAITVEASPDDAYAFWRDLGNLPRVMPHLERVEERDHGISHWVARAPFGGTVEWDAAMIEDRPGQAIAWRSVPRTGVRNAGSVRFGPAPGGRGTEVTLDMEVSVPGGPLGSLLAFAGGEHPEQQVSDALRRFKQVAETGEPIVSDATATGHKVLRRPAHPLGAGEAEQARAAVRNDAPAAAGMAS